ncbi:type II toxin-antitoxin system Phd/YefM family antitoxin [Rosistilla oblonga]|uniref:type II toxin-antitoxin system Phd/YefM family antitoxin n=1 Tax=Rosistilla oblonga TaxID=2527990 RepID=UPI003A97F935
MATVSIEDAQSKLAELIHSMAPGEALIITDGSQPVACLTATDAPPPPTPRKPGTLAGSVTYMADDFDAPLDELRDYMP